MKQGISYNNLSATKLLYERNYYLDFSKGVLITLVVIGHTMQYLVCQDHEFWSNPLFKLIYMFHMPLFMAIAGYLAHNSIVSTKPMQYILKRSVSYIVPIFTWATIYQTAITMLSSSHSFSNLPVDILTIAIDSLWFLWVLLGSLMLTSLAYATGRIRAVVLLLIYVVVLLLPNKSHLPLLKYMFPFFVFGFIVASIEISKFITPVRLRIATALSGIGTLVCYFFWGKNTYVYLTGMTMSQSNLSNIALRYIAGFIVSIFFSCLFFYIYEIINKKDSKPVTTIGKDSIYIYIIQGYVFMIILRLAKHYFTPISNLFLGIITAISIGVLITYVCWFTGSIISRNKIVAMVLFGKT